MRQIAQSSFDIVSNLNCESSEELMTKFESLRQLPELVIIKDAKSRYLAITERAATFLGWSSSEQAIGCTDYDMPCQAAETANQWIAQDQQVVLSDSQPLSLNICNYANGWATHLCLKESLKDKSGNLLGVYCYATFTNHMTNIAHLNNLWREDQKISGFKKSLSYVLNPEHSPLPTLTPRQESIVFLMIRGKPMKEIAYILKISTRTVESHIEDIKFRLGCYTKGQVIEKAIDAGFLYYIPQEL